MAGRYMKKSWRRSFCPEKSTTETIYTMRGLLGRFMEKEILSCFCRSREGLWQSTKGNHKMGIEKAKSIRKIG